MTNYKGETSLETRKQAEELLAELRRQAYAEGYEQAKKDAEKDTNGEGMDDEIFEDLKRNSAKRLQGKRDRIVEQAKVDIEGLMPKDALYKGKYYMVEGIYDNLVCYAEFVVNKEKRTVVALMRGYNTGEIYAKGIAKCTPDDCFNAHIGKAIALRRALGLEVPNEYIYAPQPTEVRVGDIIRVNLDDGGEEISEVIEIDTRKDARLSVILPGRMIEFPSSYAELIDDSREEIDGEADAS